MCCAGSKSLPKQRRSLPDDRELSVTQSLLGSPGSLLDNADLHQWPEPLYVYVIF